jgi:hypothetical protein
VIKAAQYSISRAGEENPTDIFPKQGLFGYASNIEVFRRNLIYGQLR